MWPSPLLIRSLSGEMYTAVHTRDISSGVRSRSTSLFLIRTASPVGRFSATMTLPSSNSIASLSNGVSFR